MSERLRRLLLLVPAARARPGIQIAELAASLGCSENHLREDIDFLACVGAPPYLPDDLIDIELRNDRVYVTLPQGFERPARLLATEAAALVLAARAVAPHDPLVRSATDKLAQAITPTHKQLYESLLARFGGEPPKRTGDVEKTLRKAIAERRKVEIVYFAQTKLTAAAQVVSPRAVASVGDLAYLSLQKDDGTERMYRVDRISSAKLLDDRFETLPDVDLKAELERLGSLEQRAEFPRAVVRFARSVAGAAGSRHSMHRSIADGGIEVDLPYSTVPWLVSYALSWGGAAEIISPPEAREALRLAVNRAIEAHRAQ